MPQLNPLFFGGIGTVFNVYAERRTSIPCRLTAVSLLRRASDEELSLPAW